MASPEAKALSLAAIWSTYKVAVLSAGEESLVRFSDSFTLKAQQNAEISVATTIDNTKYKTLFVGGDNFATTDVSQIGIWMHNNLMTSQRDDSLSSIDRFGKPRDRSHSADLSRRQESNDVADLTKST